MASMLRYERKAYQSGANVVAGVDEAGRGPLAGPVTAAAVILPRNFQCRGLTDSKQLSAEEREFFYEKLTNFADLHWAVATISVETIDAINILQATWRAMQHALDALSVRPDHVLVDGLPVKTMKIAHTAIIDGDQKSYSIAAASVIAKVTRDRIMCDLHEKFPQYNFARHKGYATPEHFELLKKFGPSPVHRRSFRPLYAEFVQQTFSSLEPVGSQH
jgi:ribonuclease HII